MGVLALAFLGVALAAFSSTMHHSRKPERFAINRAGRGQARATEARIDAAYALATGSIGALMTLSNLPSRGPTWATALSLIPLLRAVPMFLHGRRPRT